MSAVTLKTLERKLKKWIYRKPSHLCAITFKQLLFVTRDDIDDQNAKQ